jgi:hypothetical protein
LDGLGDNAGIGDLGFAAGHASTLP